MSLGEHIENLGMVLNSAVSYLRGEAKYEINGETYKYRSSFLRGYWEAEYFFQTESAIYEDAISELEDGDVFYDVGANLGFFTCIMAREGAEAFSFEPDPLTADELRKNLDRNSIEASVFEYAISNRDAEGELELKRGPNGTESLTQNGKNTVSVDTRKLDSLDIPPPDIVKIDTEGHETQVLEGMEETLAEKALLYVEAHGDQQLSSIEDILSEEGYRTEIMFAREDGNYFLKAASSN
ncbi:MAG: FkbM family methyltransferase [Candidatus Nanohalobium sp.]